MFVTIDMANMSGEARISPNIEALNVEVRNVRSCRRKGSTNVASRSSPLTLVLILYSIVTQQQRLFRGTLAFAVGTRNGDGVWPFLLQDFPKDTGDGDESGRDGYVFNSSADLKEIRMQRQAIWELLKNLGSHVSTKCPMLNELMCWHTSLYNHLL